MFVFVVPLKSRARTDSWERLSRICDRTLRSICAQTSGNFRVIIVCNQTPDVTFKHPAIEYLEVDELPTLSGAKDKWRKIKLGMLESSKYNPQFVMHCDADDCVSNQLVAFTEKHADASGWYFSKGWFWIEGSRLLLKRNPDFHTLCGTCRIMRFDALKEHLDEEYPLHSHKETEIFGVSLNPLPFKGAVYVMGHGENLYSHADRLKRKTSKFSWIAQLKRSRHYRFLTPMVRQEFGLYNLSEG
jgi:hypothetical protein